VKVKNKKNPNHTEIKWNLRKAASAPPGLDQCRAWVLNGVQTDSLSKPLRGLDIVAPGLLRRQATAVIPENELSAFTELEAAQADAPVGYQLDVSPYHSHPIQVRQQVALRLRRHPGDGGDARQPETHETRRVCDNDKKLEGKDEGCDGRVKKNNIQHPPCGRGPEERLAGCARLWSDERGGDGVGDAGDGISVL
jgi:hypothetical protein